MTEIKAASSSKMNRLHDKVADIFLAVLARYNARLDIADKLIAGEYDNTTLSDELLTALIDEGMMPNASMMAAITKFLKDNDVLFEKEKLDQISDQQRALEEKRKTRPSLAQLSIVPKVDAA